MVSVFFLNFLEKLSEIKKISRNKIYIWNKWNKDPNVSRYSAFSLIKKMFSNKKMKKNNFIVTCRIYKIASIIIFNFVFVYCTWFLHEIFAQVYRWFVNIIVIIIIGCRSRIENADSRIFFCRPACWSECLPYIALP